MLLVYSIQMKEHLKETLWYQAQQQFVPDAVQIVRLRKKLHLMLLQRLYIWSVRFQTQTFEKYRWFLWVTLIFVTSLAYKRSGQKGSVLGMFMAGAPICPGCYEPGTRQKYFRVLLGIFGSGISEWALIQKIEKWIVSGRDEDSKLNGTVHESLIGHPGSRLTSSSQKVDHFHQE